MPQYIDCHTHVQFADYDEDREEVIVKTLADGTWMINVGTKKDTSKSAVELAEKYDKGVYAIVGDHPIHAVTCSHDTDEPRDNAISRTDISDIEYYKELAGHTKVVGIGETGLDYFRLEGDSKQVQREAFIQHIELANEVEKPLMLHIRPSRESTESYTDALEILNQYAKVPGNAHFFAGSKEDAKGFLDLGYSVSFTGVITFTSDYDEVIRYVPLESMLSETDAPYVAPVPYRGKRNEPLHVKEVVSRVAEIKGKPLEEVREQFVENAFKFFKLAE